jgi:hypothetical protein
MTGRERRLVELEALAARPRFLYATNLPDDSAEVRRRYDALVAPAREQPSHALDGLSARQLVEMYKRSLLGGGHLL